jgi:hypothetical protein
VGEVQKVLCRIGLHTWQRRSSPEGEDHRTCRRCGKDGDDSGVAAAFRAGWWT